MNAIKEHDVLRGVTDSTPDLSASPATSAPACGRQVGLFAPAELER